MTKKTGVYKLFSLFLCLGTIVLSAPAHAQDKTMPKNWQTLTRSDSPDAWSAARLRGEEPAGFAGYPSRRSFVWLGAQLVHGVPNHNSPWNGMRESLQTRPIPTHKVCALENEKRISIPQISLNDIYESGLYSSSLAEQSHYPESIANLATYSQQLETLTAFRFPALQGRIYAWDGQGKPLGNFMVNHDFISPLFFNACRDTLISPVVEKNINTLMKPIFDMFGNIDFMKIFPTYFTNMNAPPELAKYGAAPDTIKKNIEVMLPPKLVPHSNIGEGAQIILGEFKCQVQHVI